MLDLCCFILLLNENVMDFPGVDSEVAVLESLPLGWPWFTGSPSLSIIGVNIGMAALATGSGSLVSVKEDCDFDWRETVGADAHESGGSLETSGTTASEFAVMELFERRSVAAGVFEVSVALALFLESIFMFLGMAISLSTGFLSTSVVDTGDSNVGCLRYSDLSDITLELGPNCLGTGITMVDGPLGLLFTKSPSFCLPFPGDSSA